MKELSRVAPTTISGRFLVPQWRSLLTPLLRHIYVRLLTLATGVNERNGDISPSILIRLCKIDHFSSLGCLIVKTMAGLSNLDVAREIRRRVRESKIIFLTLECDEDLMQEAFTLGASGYVVKTMAGSDLLAALEAVTSGKQFASSTTGGLHFHIDSAHAPDLPIVTPSRV